MSDVKNNVSTVNHVEPLPKVSGGKQGAFLLEVYKQKLLLFKTQRDLVEQLKTTERLVEQGRFMNNEFMGLADQMQYLKSPEDKKKLEDKILLYKRKYLDKHHVVSLEHAKKVGKTHAQIDAANKYLQEHAGEVHDALSSKITLSGAERDLIIKGCKKIKTVDVPALKSQIHKLEKISEKNKREPLNTGALERAVEYGEALVEFGERVGSPTQVR
jgi:hypothetical protein